MSKNTAIIVKWSLLKFRVDFIRQQFHGNGKVKQGIIPDHLFTWSICSIITFRVATSLSGIDALRQLVTNDLNGG